MTLMLAVLPVSAGVPAWWRDLPKQPALSARFIQESESAVFGNLRREGRLLIGRGGKLRATYDSGLLVVSDGRRLTQYDPDTRTAQRVELARAVRDYPLLGLLLDPARVETLFRVEPLADGRIRLHPKEAGLPAIDVEGRNGLLRAIVWTDPTGARQRLELVDATLPTAPAPAVFKFQPPEGTRWATPNG